MNIRLHDAQFKVKVSLGEITEPGYPRPIRLREEQIQVDYVSHTRCTVPQKAHSARAATVPRSASGL